MPGPGRVVTHGIHIKGSVYSICQPGFRFNYRAVILKLSGQSEVKAAAGCIETVDGVLWWTAKSWIGSVPAI